MPPRIAVVGSLMMDVVVRAPRLPLTGESLLSHSVHIFPGGKGGNQAAAAKRLGADVVMIGRVGADEFGVSLRAALEAEGVDTSFVSVDPHKATGVAVPVVLDGGANAIFALPQANLRLSPVEIQAASASITGAAALLVQFEVGMEATFAAMLLARQAGVPVFLNPAPIAPHDPAMLQLASVIVANEVEAAALAPGANGDHRAELRSLCNIAPIAIVTLGEAGSVAADSVGFIETPAFRVESVDSVGAGDAFCGAFAVSLAGGARLEDALRFANAAGALAVTKPGAQAALPTRREVEALLGTC